MKKGFVFSVKFAILVRISALRFILNPIASCNCKKVFFECSKD